MVNVLVYTAQLNTLKDFIYELQEYVKENYEDITVETADTKEAFSEKVSECSYDVIYYTLCRGKTQEDVVAELHDFRLQCPECDVLLLGETEEYAVAGYSIHAYDYIPFLQQKDGLVPSFLRIIKKKYSYANTVYYVRIKGIWRSLKSRDIVYMETNNHHVLFHMENGQVYKKLANFNSLTPPIESNDDLFQCHKSYVVNGRYIRGMVQNSFIMTDGVKVSISKPNRKNAKNFFSQCIVKGYLEQ